MSPSTAEACLRWAIHLPRDGAAFERRSESWSYAAHNTPTWIHKYFHPHHHTEWCRETEVTDSVFRQVSREHQR